MAEFLDQLDKLKKIDPDNMITLVEQFLQQCIKGEEIARATELPDFGYINRVVICGMGGSAIGGDLIRSYAASMGKASVAVVRNYDLPNYVDKDSLIIASSYSGNTEETLSAYSQAKKKGAKILAVTTGGKLAALCKKDGNPAILVPGGISPRAALGYSFMPLLVSFERLGLIPAQKTAIKELYKILEKNNEENNSAVLVANNPAKQLAKCLYQTIPVIYSGQDAFQPISTRWRCQFNENAKVFAHDMVVPEMNHNEILGWKNPSSILKKFHSVYLLDKGYNKQTLKRFEVMKKIIEPSASAVSEIHSTGSGLLARMFSVIYFGDFVSVYLAYLYKEDPTPIKAIDYLKNELAK